MEFSAAVAVHLADQRRMRGKVKARIGDNPGSAMPPEIAKATRHRYVPDAAGPARTGGSPARDGVNGDASALIMALADRLLTLNAADDSHSYACFGMIGGSGRPLGSEDEPTPG